MISAQEIFEQLDHHAEEFNFPMLDNAFFNLAQTRLSVFKNSSEWVLVIETVGYTSQSFENTLYAFGNNLPKTGIIVGVDNFISPASGDSYWDDEGAFRADPFEIECDVHGERIRLSVTKVDYEAAGLSVNEFTPTTFIRFLSHMCREKLWMPSDQVLLSEVHAPVDLPLFFRTQEWEHPDLSAEQKPSETEFFQQLALAIEQNSLEVITCTKNNTQWRNWTWTDEDA